MAGAALVYYRAPLLALLKDGYGFLADREKCAALLKSLGWKAPFVYMALQTIQVILAPIPGEATGFIGGYLFGTLGASLYSTISLTLGSWINFHIGRFLGEHWIRRLIPKETRSRMDFLLRHQGAVVIFILFLLPGFPKDSLCLFLGLSSLPIKVLVLLSGIGRIPGTILLSAQGASLFDRDYLLLGVLLTACVIFSLLAWHWREPLYRWIEKQNHASDSHEKRS